MKNNLKRKRLQIMKQDIRVLTANDVRKIRGGRYDDTDDILPPESYDSCCIDDTELMAPATYVC